MQHRTGIISNKKSKEFSASFYQTNKTAKSNLFTEVDKLTARDTKLRESYNERTRRGQAFTADLTKYDAKQQETVKRAIESGILNNTNRTHEFVDLIAKISANKGVSFNFADNAKLKESGFAIDGKQVNGFVTADGVTININSAKALNSVVGHEITHVLEGTELYNELQSAITEYAKSKGDYQGRFDTLTELYKDIEGADIDAELTADLVGDYLFTDADFVQRLSTEHRGVFQKLFDEIKHLCKLATAGTKEARELEKVKKLFEDAYRTETKNPTADGGVKYALGMNMTETQRYSELKNRTLLAVESADQTQYQEQLDSIAALPPKAKSKAEKQIYTIAEKLGILRKPMTTPEIQFEFQISKNNGLKKSLNNQLEYGGSYSDFAKALINLDKIIPNAVLIDAYTKDRYSDTNRADKRFEGGYVLLGAFQDSENIVPVKMTIKKEVGETGNLYVVVAMTKINRTSVMGSEGTTQNGDAQPLPVTGSVYSIQEIISKINTKDADFLKYLPDGFLSEEQKAAKQEAIKKQKAKVSQYSLSEITTDNASLPGNFYGKDVALEEIGTPTQEDIAQMEQEIATAPAAARNDAEDLGAPTREDILQMEMERELYGDWRMTDPLDIKVEKLYRLMLREQISEEDYNAQLAKADRQYQQRGSRIEEALERVQQAYSKHQAVTADESAAEQKEVEAVLGEKDAYVSKQANALYDEVKGMQKGKRVSNTLSYLLDTLDLSEENKAESYNSLRTALLNIRDNPNQTVNPNSAVEAAAREMLGREYDSMAEDFANAEGVAKSIYTKMESLRTELENNQSLREQSNAENEF